jgi:hypothetical protein
MTRLSSILFASLSLSLSLAACAVDDIDDVDVSSVDQAVTGELGLHGAPEPHEMSRRGAGKPGGGGTSPLLKYKSPGPVLVATKTAAVFWGPQWSNPAFAGDKITGLDAFFEGFGGSQFANTNTEYTHKDGRYVTNAATYQGHTFDTSSPPTKALTVSQAVAEACKMAGSSPDPDTVYFIYTSTTAGHVSYCAWHSAGTCNGVTIQVAYMPNIDGIAGCDPADTTTGHSQPLAALANVTAHELSEAITDPHLDAWQDSGGSENSDKCAWRWDGNVTLSNGTEWKLQMNWSNAAYNANVSHGGTRGCIQQEAEQWSPTAAWL